MRFATLISWLVTVGLGAFMLRAWLARGGLHRERAKPGGLPPLLIFGHAAVAVVGLLAWGAFLASASRPLAWAAVVLLTAAVSLGLCTVTLWTPYPARKPGERRFPGRPEDRVSGAPAGAAAREVADVPAVSPAAVAHGDAQPAFEVTDDMIARFLAEPGPRGNPARLDLTVAVPVVHGLAAITTFLLAVMSAIT
jgi:hypothetical protein